MICIDPGKDCGWAVFETENGAAELRHCGLWVPTVDERWTVFPGEAVLIEDQVIYPRSKARPADIIKLAKTAGRIAQILGWDSVEWVAPRTWKGTLDGDLMHVRIVEALTDTERRVYYASADWRAEGLRHNVADAIGIGLWKLGRLTPHMLASSRAHDKLKKARRRAP